MYEWGEDNAYLSYDREGIMDKKKRGGLGGGLLGQNKSNWHKENGRGEGNEKKKGGEGRSSLS